MPSILDRGAAPTKSVHICMGVGVLLIYFQWPTAWKNCNIKCNNTDKFFQIYFQTKYKFFYIKK